MFPLAIIAGWIQGHWWGFLAETTQYDPSSFLRMFSLLLKDLISDFYLHPICDTLPLNIEIYFWPSTEVRNWEWNVKVFIF